MIDHDASFDALRHVQRRQLLLRLFHEEPQRIPELCGKTKEIANAHETFVDEYLSGSRNLQAVNKDHLRTYHVHIPKLVEYGFVEWDRETNVVWRGWRFEELTPLLEFLAGYEDDQSQTELVIRD